MTARYTEQDISYFATELLKLRAKPQMYIGPTDDSGVFTILREALDNSVDEARAGRNKSIHVLVSSRKNQFWVVDQGVGIPVKKHPKANISTLTHVLTALQSSGKMKGGAYKAAIGTHGVGIKATNALSKEFQVWTYRDDAGGWWSTRFEKAKEVAKPKTCEAPKVPMFGRPKKGTVIYLSPDEKIFGKSKLKVSQLRTWCRITSYMNPKLSITLIDMDEGKDSKKEFYSKTGIPEYLDHRLAALKASPFLGKKPLVYSSPSMDLAVSFADVEGNEVQYFTNTIRNPDGGVHTADFLRALVTALKPYKGKLHYTPSDIQEGLVGILNYKIDAPRFSSQTKEKLVDERVKNACYEECVKALSTYFAKEKTLAKAWVKRASELRSKTESFLKDKQLIKKVREASKSINTKLAPVVGGAPVEKRELILVEGDSAGGGCKRARDKSFQAVYPLKGKPLNVIDATKDKIVNNKEVYGLLAAVGVDMSGKKQGEVGYGKIICMADPDVDGKHINCLMLAVLWKFLPSVFKNKQVYVVRAPLFKSRHKGVVYFGMTKEEIHKKTGSKSVDITYIKGWGEVSEGDLGVALDPAQRTLYQVQSPDGKGAKRFQLLMGKDSAYRKKLFGVI